MSDKNVKPAAAKSTATTKPAAAKSTAAAKPAAAKEKKEPKRGVGTAAKEAIRDGKTNDETLAIVQAEFPEAKTSKASINWYRNKLRTDGEKVLTARELKKKADGDAPAKAKAKGKDKAKDPLD
jgi:hypothetical protein